MSGKNKSVFLLVFCFIIGCILNMQAQNICKGRVTDLHGENLAFVSIFDSTYKYTAVTNESGEFELKIPGDSMLLFFQLLGYETFSKNIVGNIDNQVKLSPSSFKLPEIEYVAGEDPAIPIMKAAIQRRKINSRSIKAYSADVYGKVLVKLESAPQKFLGQDLGDMAGILDTNRQGIIYLSETVSEIRYREGEWKEIVTASKVSGDNAGLTFNSFSKTLISFYDEFIDFDRAYISPLNDKAFTYYDFFLIRTYEDETGHQNHLIRVRPKSEFEPCFDGYIYLSAKDFQLTGVSLNIRKNALKTVFLDTLYIHQVFKPNPDDNWFVLSQNIGFSVNVFGFETNGYANYLFINQNFKPEFDNKSFGAEIFKIEESATKQADEYWETTRPLPLTKDEINDYRRKDSLQLVWKSDTFLDSLDRVNNQFKPVDLFFGYSATNSRKNISYGISSPVYNFQFSAVEGFNLKLPIFYVKTDTLGSRQTGIRAFAKYGFSDHKFKWGTSLTRIYNPKKLGKWELILVDDLEHYDGIGNLSEYANSIQSLVYKQNYARLFRKSGAELSWQQELFNGLLFSIGSEFSSRHSVENASNYSVRKQSLSYVPNNILGVENYALNDKIWKINVNLRIRPGQKFSDYGSFKVRESGLWPDIFVKLTSAVPLDETFVAYSRLAIRLEDEEVSFRHWGYGKTMVEFGHFLNERRVHHPDLFHFQGNELSTAFVSNYVRGFRLMPYYEYSSTAPYVSAFYEHHFDGFITDKIPLINRTGIQFVTNAAALVRRHKPYLETGLGLEGFSIGPIDLVRFDYIWSFGPGGLKDHGFKLGLSALFERDFKL